MNSGWQTKSQVKNTECRNKPSQLQLICKKTGCATPKPSPFQTSNVVCFAVGCIKACMWVWKEHHPSEFKHISWIFNGLRCFSLASLHMWCVPDVFASLSTSPPSHLPSAIVQCSVPIASPRGSPGTEGCCKGSLGGHQQTLPWLCLCEIQARPQPCCGADKSPVPPRAGLQYPQGRMDAGTPVPTKY